MRTEPSSVRLAAARNGAAVGFAALSRSVIERIPRAARVHFPEEGSPEGCAEGVSACHFTNAAETRLSVAVPGHRRMSNRSACRGSAYTIAGAPDARGHYHAGCRGYSRGVAGDRTMLSVVFELAEVRNSRRTEPTSRVSPSASSAGAAIFAPRTNVPFLLPRSSIVARP